MQQSYPQQASSISESEEEPFITGLDQDYVRAVYGQTAYIDAGRDMEIQSELPIERLGVSIENHNDPFNPYEHIDIDSSDGRIELSDKLNPGSVISIDGIVIGSVYRNSNQWTLDVRFTENASHALVQHFIRSLVYINTAEDYLISTSSLLVEIKEKGGSWSSSTINVTTADEDKIILSTNTDTIQGTDGNDVFYASEAALYSDELDGGDGDDTLVFYSGSIYGFDLGSLTTFKSIETVEGSRYDDRFLIKAEQMSDLRQFSGGAGTDDVIIRGNNIDLRHIDFVDIESIQLWDDNTTITFDDVEDAKLIDARDTQGETLIFEGTLTDDERMAIHRQGIDTIITHEQDGTTKSTTHHAPEVLALDGDRLKIDAGQTIHIDAGRNAVINSDDGLLSRLEVTTKGSPGTGHQLGLASSRITLSDGLTSGSRVSVDGEEIGYFQIASPKTWTIRFNEAATPERVQEILHAITYDNMYGTISEQCTVKITLVDAGNRATTSRVIVDPWDWSVTRVTEGQGAGTEVGTLASEDADGKNITYSFTEPSATLFELEETAEGGYAVKVKEGVVLDYENLTHHSFTVVMQIGSQTLEKTFYLMIGDVDEAPTVEFAAVSVTEGAGAETSVGTLTMVDPEGGEIEYTLSAASRDFFELQDDGNGGYKVVVKSGIVLDYENPAHRSFTVTVSDGLNEVPRTFNLNLQNVNEAPSLTFTSAKVSEGVGPGTVVGTLVVQDIDGPSLEYSVTGASAALFELEETTAGHFDVKVKAGVTLDFETLSHREFTVSIFDGANTVEEAYALNLTDIVDVWTGTRGKDTLRGQSGADIIKGLAGDDKLYGNAGNDILYGGTGKDSLKGNEGQDTFVFNSKPNKRTNKDKIVDFSVTDDTIWLDNKVFTKLGAAGSEAVPAELKKDYFVVGSKAKDRDDFVIYDKVKGVLLYDADGSGSRYNAVEIATLSKNLRITEKDFFVV